MPPDLPPGLVPTGGAAYVAQVDDLARRCGFPLLAIPDAAIGPGEDAWSLWIAGAGRLQLVRALGALTARAARGGGGA